MWKILEVYFWSSISRSSLVNGCFRGAVAGMLRIKLIVCCWLVLGGVRIMVIFVGWDCWIMIVISRGML